MMENTNRPKLTHKILVIITVVAFVLAGWLTGHILRFALPVLWHPPIEKITPQIQNGFEPEWIRHEVVLTGKGIFISNGSVLPGVFAFESCVGSIYYTSLPAKCRSASGELGQVGGTETERLFVPPVR